MNVKSLFIIYILLVSICRGTVIILILELRRAKTDLLMYYKIIHGIIPIGNILTERKLSVTRGNGLKLCVSKLRSNKEKAAFKN